MYHKSPQGGAAVIRIQETQYFLKGVILQTTSFTNVFLIIHASIHVFETCKWHEIKYLNSILSSVWQDKVENIQFSYTHKQKWHS